jgi:hypothetical protein
VREELQCDGCGRIRTGAAGPRMENVEDPSLSLSWPGALPDGWSAEWDPSPTNIGDLK